MIAKPFTKQVKVGRSRFVVKGILYTNDDGHMAWVTVSACKLKPKKKGKKQ